MSKRGSGKRSPGFSVPPATAAGIKMEHVPYKGSAPALLDLVGGNINVMFDAYASSKPFINDNKIRLLAVTTAKRSALLPDVPTIAEQGLPGYEAYSWAALFAPAGTPKEVVAKINTDFNQVMRDPDVKQRLYVAGAEANPGTPEDLAKLLQAEMDKWAKVVKAANIKID